MTKHVQVRLEQHEYDDFTARATKAGFKSVQEAGRHVLLAFLEQSAESSVPEKLRPYLRKLERVLSSGNRDLIAAVTKPLDVFASLVEIKEPRTDR